MIKRYLYFLTIVTLLGLIVGCSINKERFNDENIIFNVVKTEETMEHKSYKIEISNKTGFDLTHLSFNLSYPIKTSNGSKSNPYVVEGKSTSTTTPLNLKSGETITYTIYAPIQEVYGDSDLLDFENPSIVLKGYYLDGKEEIQFGIYGGLSVLAS